MEKQIILNRIKTPDGTILTSHHRHDCKIYVDKNGETYIVDGGISYLRRSVNVEPYEDLSLFSDTSFDIIRDNFHWGSRSKDGKSALNWKPLSRMEDSHLQAILDQNLGSELARELMKQEITFRQFNNIII
jgi:hypothetical protein